MNLRTIQLAEVKLTMETTTNTSGDVGPGRGAKASVPVSPPVRLLQGEDATGPQMSLSRVPHTLMYLSLKMEAMSPHKEVHLEEEILYQYPASDASAGLKGVRGIYLTLCDMLENVTGGHVVSSTLLLNKHLVHVGYWKEGDALLVVGLPAERYTWPLREGSWSSLKTLCCQISSQGAFAVPAVTAVSFIGVPPRRAFCGTERAPELDRFFGLFFRQLIRPPRLGDGSSAPPPDISGSVLLNRLPAVRWLPLPAKVKTDLDSVLNDFEASDFGEMSEDFFGVRRLYGILGSCLFYKSYLIANHLPKEELLDICLYVRHYCLLPTAPPRRVGPLVIWREVFPPGPLRGRRFLLIVGRRCWMQCVLLEVGGCVSHCSASPGPDCVYVDQVNATLLRLEIAEEAIEERLSAPAAPHLFCADLFLQAGIAQARLDGLALGNSLFGEKARDCGVEGHVDIGSGSSARIPGGRQDSLDASGGIFKVQRRKHSNPLMKTLSGRDTGEIWSAGAENAVFHYVLMETVQGIFIAPTQTEEAQLGGSIHPLLIRNFYRCCLSIRAVLKENSPLRVGPASARRASGFGPSQRARSPVPVRPRKLGRPAETCSHPDVLGHRVNPLQVWRAKKSAAELTFGSSALFFPSSRRLLLEPVPQEFYVCFHNSVPEFPVEMAFRLSFGLAT
ncbi:protein inturned isoform X4 [Phyllopteryx taeniolatus]|uniref:protein inturned isoform X4 n=1 Tax=Phyllopteryx taeniolatus TaxID=161469 RepID=UPI002AD30E93|nr:protein inturned isoform X4 [Phyllopteryx taeniolatus]